MITIRWFVCFSFLLAPAVLSAEICSWVDASGVRRYSNTGNCPEDANSTRPEYGEGEVSSRQNGAGLLFYGVYRDGIHYLRFYADGTVVSVDTAAWPGEMASWFGRSGKNVKKGRYRMSRGKTIEFHTIHKKYGAMLCKGKVSDKAIHLAFFRVDKRRFEKGYSPMEGTARYTFIPIEFTGTAKW